MSVKLHLPIIGGKLLSNSFLKGKIFKFLRNSQEVQLIGLLTHVNARCTRVYLREHHPIMKKGKIHLLNHGNHKVECPWCMSVNPHVYVWQGQLRCDRCIPLPLIESDLAHELKLIPTYSVRPQSPGYVYTSNIVYAEGEIYGCG